MIKILYYSSGNERLTENFNKEKFRIFEMKTLKDLIIFLLNNYDVQAFISEFHESVESRRTILEILFNFNEFLPVYFIDRENQDRASYHKIHPGIKFVRSIDEIFVHFEPYSNKRKYYRINWPLNAIIADSIESLSGRASRKGQIVSLSLGGAYINVSDFKNVRPSSEIALRIIFANFTFLVNAKVIRIAGNSNEYQSKSAGIAVEFHDVTDATKKFLNTIINDRVISMLFRELNGK